MDDYTKNLLVKALRDPAGRNATISNENSNPDNLPDQLGIRNSSNPSPPAYVIKKAQGEDIGGASLDVNRDRLSLQKDGQIGNGYYYGEVNKPFNGDVNAQLNYLLPHKNGYLQATGNLIPGKSSFFVNYKTNF